MPRLSDTDLIINPDGSIYHLNLKPRQVTDTIIAVGDPNRVHRVSSFFDAVDFEMNKREFITHIGKYKGKKIMVISTGMGTDNVEILMNELDALVNIDFKKREPKPKRRKLKIVRIGTSASIQEDIRLGTHILSEYAIGMDPLMYYYDLEQTPKESDISTALQEEIRLPYLPYCVKASESLVETFADVTTPGNTVTCHGFYAPQGRSLGLPIRYPKLVQSLNYFHLDDFWLTNLEMETAGYYALARLMGHDMVSVNAIIANRVRNRFSKDPNRIIDALIKKVLDRI
ncbi:MAG: nucleoside phosphorylase [Cyclobacteriaceae bacterium]|nr:nucleoside phosphorylase [Cyclobacteriaceae bacterium HetDA_MAG_MS6]